MWRCISIPLIYYSCTINTFKYIIWCEKKGKLPYTLVIRKNQKSQVSIYDPQLALIKPYKLNTPINLFLNLATKFEFILFGISNQKQNLI